MAFASTLRCRQSFPFSGRWLDGYYTADAIFIRPSGNPMKLDVLKTMWTSESVSSTCSELVEFESCKVFADGKAAVVIYKTHEVFEYNGTPNDDNVKYSAVFELADGKWKINHAHRFSSEAK